MFVFTDFYNNEVELSFDDHPYSMEPKHVLVICQYDNEWLLTKHSGRGLEFPGGKVEKGEVAVDAAIREVKEETGGIVDTLDYIGQYRVAGKSESVIKNVYFARISKLEPQKSYYETEGPVLLKDIPKNVKFHDKFSFIMKDDVVVHSLNYIKKHYGGLTP